jgi:pyroglutamyl-peptidase
LITTLAACTTSAAPPAANPNAGLFRDFLDGKFDSAGHPLDAVVLDGATLCGKTELAGACEGDLPAAAQAGDLVTSARLRVRAHGDGDIVTMSVLYGESGNVVAHETLTASNLRATDEWTDLPITWHGDGTAARVNFVVAPGATVDLDYVENFPPRFQLALAPGSGVVGDGDHLQIEVPLGGAIEHVTLDGTDITDRVTQLLVDGKATRTDTAFRSVVDIAVADLAPMRGDVADLSLRAAGNAARMQLRRTAPACSFAGSGTKVLVTGFQPFPADATHENVSGVAVNALDVTTLHDAQVMKLILPVEYDRAAAEVADVIARCKPDVAISFGQGGDEIALEETAYNLQDTGELSGGAPDNRGIVRAATPIDAAAPATRATQLPLAAIEKAMTDGGEAPQHSTDPGRYVCNNVMFADIGAMTALGAGRAGFIHLPYTLDFDADSRARFGKVVAAAIQATVDSP